MWWAKALFFPIRRRIKKKEKKNQTKPVLWLITVIVRVIAQSGVIAHAGVIAPLCVDFSSLESFNSFSAQGSESSHRGAMAPILVPPSSVRLHAVACGLRIKNVPISVFLALCNRGSPLFVAGAYHTYIHTWKKLSLLLFFIRRPHQKKKKKAPPTLPRCGADLPSTAVPHATERRHSRQLSTYLPATHLSSAVSPPFADNTTNQLESYRHQSLYYTYLKHRTRHQTSSSCVLAETTGVCVHITQHGRVFDLLGIAHVGVTAQVCVYITAWQGVWFVQSRTYMSELPHRGVRQNGKSNHLIQFPHRGRSHRTYRSYHAPCAIKIKVRNLLIIDRTGVRWLAQLITVYQQTLTTTYTC